MPRNGHSNPPALVWLGKDNLTNETLPKFHIFPLLTVGCMHAIIGPYKEGKSFTALEVAVAIGYGIKFFGRFAVDVIGKVLYIAGEGADETYHRFIALKRARNLPDDEVVSIYKEPIDFKDPSDCGRLTSIILEHQFLVVIIDTASRCGAGDESSVDMPAFVRGMTLVQRATNCTMLPIHHTPDYDHNKPRGHTSFPAALDGVWIQKKDKKTGICRLSEGFSRWSGGNTDITSYHIEPYYLGDNIHGRAINAGLVNVGKLTERQQAVLEALRGGKSVLEISKDLGVSFGTVQGERALLIARGLWKEDVEKKKGGRPKKGEMKMEGPMVGNVVRPKFGDKLTSEEPTSEKDDDI